MTVPSPDVPPLAGFVIGITAARRKEEFASALSRRGATVVHGPAIQIGPLVDDKDLYQATRTCLVEPPDYVVATTGIGFRGWIEAADGWGLGDALLDRLSGATLLARGPKARGAMRAAGLSGEWSPPSESSSELLEKMLEMPLHGKRVALQLHGEPLPDMAQALRSAGAEVIDVGVYAWSAPDDPAPLRRLCGMVAAREVDAITFTSAPAVVSFLRTADVLGIHPEVLEAMRSEVPAMAVGPVTAGPLATAGVPTVQPERARLGALVREIETELPRRRERRMVAAHHHLAVRGRGVVVDGQYRPLPPTLMAVMRVLAEHPGHVVSRAGLAKALSVEDEHALETAIGRLRSALGDGKIVQTLVKRGYRLAYDPHTSGRY
ncbi:uroporphyrinogen-III synthase [Nakamurella endophytica]|nr:uroporphyrinogen-III synthase [Nakamurella endophytica]